MNQKILSGSGTVVFSNSVAGQLYDCHSRCWIYNTTDGNMVKIKLILFDEDLSTGVSYRVLFPPKRLTAFASLDRFQGGAGMATSAAFGEIGNYSVVFSVFIM